jgi:hypothetical protein
MVCFVSWKMWYRCVSKYRLELPVCTHHITGCHTICAPLNDILYWLFLCSYSIPKINFIPQCDAVWLCCVSSCYMLNFQLFHEPQPIPHWEHSAFWTFFWASAHIVHRTWQPGNHSNWAVTYSHQGYDLRTSIQNTYRNIFYYKAVSQYWSFFHICVSL